MLTPDSRYGMQRAAHRPTATHKMATAMERTFQDCSNMSEKAIGRIRKPSVRANIAKPKRKPPAIALTEDLTVHAWPKLGSTARPRNAEASETILSLKKKPRERMPGVISMAIRAASRLTPANRRATTAEAAR